MNTTLSDRWCVATVTSAAYAVGTEVLLTSFLRHNPWFTGTLLLIHAPDEPRPDTLRHLPNVRWHPVSDRLARCLAGDAYTAAKAPRFHSLEIFSLREFDRVLYLDSDVACTGDASRLFQSEGALLCCPDQAHFWGHARNRVSYATEDAELVSPDTVFARTFNTGMMRLTPAGLDESTFGDLLARIETRDWRAVLTGHSVSVVLNEHFSATWTEVSERFNFLISRGMTAYRRPRVAVDQAVFLHFIGRPKPWEAAGHDSIVNDDHQRALKAWHDEASHVWRS